MAKTPGNPFPSGSSRASHNSVVPTGFGRGIPLNLLAHVIEFVDDDPQTLARLCRASRVFYYMTLPHLWKDVTLRSYDRFRYNNNIAEGFGSASPFSLGLNALVTHNVSSLVQSLSLTGEWVPPDLEQCSKVGRLAESAMILNIALRAAIDRCTQLESFTWDLGTKLLPNALTGLASLSNLQSFHLRCPSSRTPQPTAELPALPHLRSFTMTNYDPICYPDDISRLLFHATNLEVLQLHFSPRMRDAGEPSVHLSHFFRRNIAAQRKLKLRKLGIYNLFARAEAPEMLGAVDTTNLSDFTSLNTFGQDEDAPEATASMHTTFLDSTWLEDMDATFPPMKAIRMDQLHRAHAMYMCRSLERLYLVNERHIKPGSTSTSGPNPTPPKSISETSTPAQTSITSTSPTTITQLQTPTDSIASTSLRDVYLENICTNAGTSLKHLIFPTRWPLDIHSMSRLIRSCPNLTQLSCSVDCNDFRVLRMIVPFLEKLYAIRIRAISPPDSKSQANDPANVKKSQRLVRGGNTLEDDWLCLDEHENMLRQELVSENDFKNLKWVGLGSNWFEVGGFEEVKVRKERSEVQDANTSEQAGDVSAETEEEEVVLRRKVRRVGWEDVKHVEIWRCDTLDII